MDGQYEQMLRERITQLRVQKDVSEHRMSLDLGKSGSYIRGITNGTSMPSLRELFNIIEYFDLTPAEFFSNIGPGKTPRTMLFAQLETLPDEDIEKVSTFVNWIRK